MTSVFAIIPVKILLKAKRRLSPFLNPKERQIFAISMLKDVLNAIKGSSLIDRVVIISSDVNVSNLAKEYKVTYIDEIIQRGMNPAILKATDWCVKNEAESMLTIPADIPLVTSNDIDEILRLGVERPSIVISPSHNGGGTNALLRSPPNAIQTHYGSKSFQKHIKEASFRQVQTYVYKNDNIGLDIDLIEDMVKLLHQNSRETESCLFLKKISIIDKLSNRGILIEY